MSVKSRKTETSEITRGRLVQAARQLFAEQGYAATSTEQIVQSAGLTRGALYHHFRGKKALFQAVFEEMQEELAARMGAVALAPADPWEQLLAGCGAALDASVDPAVRQVVLLDAPAVLGWHVWRRVDAEYGLGMLAVALQAAMDAGVLEPQPVEPLAHVILGAVTEAAMVIAHAEDAAAARDEVGATVRRLLDGLRTPHR